MRTGRPSKITLEEVEEIRRLYSENVKPIKLAYDHKISYSTVYKIISGQHSVGRGLPNLTHRKVKDKPLMYKLLALGGPKNYSHFAWDGKSPTLKVADRLPIKWNKSSDPIIPEDRSVYTYNVKKFANNTGGLRHFYVYSGTSAEESEKLLIDYVMHAFISAGDTPMKGEL